MALGDADLAGRFRNLVASSCFHPPSLVSMKLADKILPWDQLSVWRIGLRGAGRKLVVTNGCFDVLHLGHVTYLEAARAQGDALLVGVNSDQSVRELKGPDRPINSESDRASVLAALQSVDAVCVFTDRTAMRFLSTIQPDVYVKGGDYTVDTINQEERQLVEQLGGKVVVLAGVPGKSTSALVEKLRGL
jgi:rfaE bifunctional protein nucleotidyltransferase chain/domain